MAKKKQKPSKKASEINPNPPKNEYVKIFDKDWPEWFARNPQFILGQLQQWKKQWENELEENPNAKLEEAIKILEQRIQETQDKIKKDKTKKAEEEKIKYEAETRKIFLKVTSINSEELQKQIKNIKEENAKLIELSSIYLLGVKVNNQLKDIVTKTDDLLNQCLLKFKELETNHDLINSINLDGEWNTPEDEQKALDTVQKISKKRHQNNQLPELTSRINILPDTIEHIENFTRSDSMFLKNIAVLISKLKNDLKGLKKLVKNEIMLLQEESNEKLLTEEKEREEGQRQKESNEELLTEEKEEESLLFN